jgi:xylose isomerase
MTIFSHIPVIRYEGTDSPNPLAFRHYDKDRKVLGKRMEDHLRWAVCYWHSFHWGGTDIFGLGTLERPWLPGQPVSQERADLKCEAAFDFMHRLTAPYYCFHDADVIADYRTIADYTCNLETMVEQLARRQRDSAVKLLWGTANLTGHPRYAAGAATNPDPEVFAWAAHQVRSMMNATKALGGENYVLWGGREGYDTVLNTNMRHELDQLGRFMAMIVDHKHKTGFKGTILIEPKPFEPAKHMYDRDTATVYGFLKRYGLENEIRVNIEANHATLAGNSFEHEVATATALGIFGSIDINRGDAQNGWDTDQFPNNVPELALTLYYILKDGGFKTGGFNFDAKVRRQSVDPEDLFHAHIGGIDVLARALLAAAAIVEDGKLDAFVQERYAGWRTPFGQDVLSGRLSLAEAADHAVRSNADPRPKSGRQEYLENLINRFT